MSLADWFADTKKYLDKNGLRLLSKLTERKFRFKTMPVASEEYEGVIAEYIGTVTPDYMPGYFYRCQNTGTVAVPVWTWVQHDVQPNDDTPHFIGTQAQWDAQGANYPEGTIVGLIDEEDTTYEHGKYALVETVTGKRWYNGKPIYRKVFVDTIPAPAGQKNVSTGFPAGMVDDIVDQKVSLMRTDMAVANKYWWTDTYVAGSSSALQTVNVYLQAGGTSFYVGNLGSWPATARMIIVLEYTKTTD